MKLQEIFDQLSYGEFSQLSIGGADTGVINEGNYARVLGHLNLGLTALFKRFKLKERRLTMPLQANADVYQLNFDDILKIEKILTSDDVELSLNEEGNPYSCFTPTLTSIRVPQSIREQGTDLPDELLTTSLTVVYRANHPKLVMTLGVLTPQTKDIELPSSHLQALLYFVASRANNPVGMVNEFNAGNTWYKKYELECQRLEQENLQVDQAAGNYRLERNGWV